MKKMFEIKLYAQELKSFEVKEIEVDTDKSNSEVHILEPTPLIVNKIIFKLPRIAPYDSEFKERLEDFHYAYLIQHEDELKGKQMILELMQKLVDNKMHCEFNTYEDYFKMILEGHQRYINKLKKENNI